MSQTREEQFNKFMEDQKDRVSFTPLVFLDTGKAQRAADNFMKWLFQDQY